MTSNCNHRRFADRRFLPLLGIAAALALTTFSAAALESDRDQPMDIQAVDSDTDLNSGVLKLIGNVSITQGSLRIEAETGEVHQPEQAAAVTRVILEGSPACLEQDLDNAAGKMRACSRKIDYDRQNDSVVLTGNVRITEPRGTLTGERVTYNIAEGRVQGQSGGGESRVRFVIPPRAREADDDSP